MFSYDFSFSFVCQICSLWLPTKLHISGEVPYGPQTNYEVTVVTGNVRHAGTDAHVYLQMYGKAGMTQEVELDDEKDNFERNMTDVFKASLLLKIL